MIDVSQQLIGLGMNAFETVARATSEKPKSLHWTELALYRRRDSGPDDYPAFMAEIVGATKVEGEQRRERRAPFLTLSKALNWGAFNQQSALFDELRRKAFAWVDEHYESGGLKAIGFGGHAGAGEVKAKLLPRVTEDAPFEPDDGTFREALLWLYDPETDDVHGAAHSFVRDWCASPEDIGKFAGGFYSAGQPIDQRDVIDVIVHEGEYGLPPWAETFRRAMRHFRRESFHAARNS